MRISIIPVILLLAGTASAQTLPFRLSIQGENFHIERNLELSDLGEGKTQVRLDFADQAGEVYRLDLAYKPLPANRSYPGNLDISVKNARDDKLGYLFFAINEVAFLKRMGRFGFIVDIDGEPLDVRFEFDPNVRGNLAVANLDTERFVMDVLAPQFDFQMIL